MTASEFYSKRVKIGDTVLFRGERVTVLNALTVSSDKQGKAMKVEIAKDVWVDVEEIEVVPYKSHPTLIPMDDGVYFKIIDE